MPHTTYVRFLVAGVFALSCVGTPETAAPVRTELSDALARGSLAFEAIEDRGRRYDFVSRGAGPGVGLSAHEAVLPLSAPANRQLRMRFVGGVNRRAKSWTGERAALRVNSYLGSDPSTWREAIPTYTQVGYRDVYRGIDVVYYGNERLLEYDFVVRPGADPRAIALQFDGARTVRVDANGELVIGLDGGEIRHRRPVIYQEVSGRRQPIEGRYHVTASKTVTFIVGEYDRRRALVIDPVILLSGFLNGAVINDIATDESGALYLAGAAASEPIVALIMKVGAPDGADYVTVLGGPAADASSGALSIAIDAGGSVYIAGSTGKHGTTAPSDSFPTTVGAFDRTQNGGMDGFVAKLNSAGSLVYSTYVGGLNFDFAASIAVDASGSAYIGGTTSSANFPATQALSGGQDAFVAKLTPTGSALAYARLVGGNAGENGNDLAVDSSGAAYITGVTVSTDFPTTAGAYDTTMSGPADVFLTRINPSGTAVTFSTYLGGSGPEAAHAIALDAFGAVYVAGSSESTDFPRTSGAFDTTYGGNGDAFITKFRPDGAALLYSTYLGGASGEFAQSMAVDADGVAYITGRTSSQAYPTTPDAVRAIPASTDALLSKLSADGSTLIYSTLLGGNRPDDGNAVAVDASGAIFVAGDTSSADFPVAGSWFSPTLTDPSTSNAFVLKIGEPADTTAPVLTLQDLVTVEARSAAGATVFYPVTIADDDLSATLVCTPHYGSVFPLGSTTVACTGEDSSGNVSTGTFTVAVVDTTPPTLANLPPDVAIEAMGSTGSPFVWSTPTATDQVSGILPVSCAPASETLFPLGVTPVSCTATDGAGNTMPYTFTVTVRDTRAPAVTVQAPMADDALSSPVTFDIVVTDQVGVNSVQVQTSLGTVSLNRISGSAQVGRWVGPVPANLADLFVSSAFSATVFASDGSNTTTRTVVVDNDGIDAVVDRFGSSDNSSVFNTAFDDGTTSGRIQRHTWWKWRAVSVKKPAGSSWIRIALPGVDPTLEDAVNFEVCSGASKLVQLQFSGESADVKCASSTLYIHAITALPAIEVFKYYLSPYSGVGYYYLAASLPSGQGTSTGSPFTADPDNTEPIDVTIVHVTETGLEEPMGSFAVDPGESVDVQILHSGTGRDDRIELEALAGDIAVTITGQTQTVGAGETSEFVVTPPSARFDQTIAFGSIAARALGESFAPVVAASSGLPVSIAATGSCVASGGVVTLTAVGTCTLVASQPGDSHFNPASSVARSFPVFYTWSGVLEPLSATGSTSAKQGSTVPVKFRLTGPSAGVTNLPARIFGALVSAGGAVGAEIELAGRGGNSGNVFRYDAASGQYIFNWDTRELSEGTWRVRIDLLDGNTARTAGVVLRK
jgi:hypothetical protein